MIKLVATDLDGTLLPTKHSASFITGEDRAQFVTAYSVEVLRRAQDRSVYVVPVTARPLRTTLPIMEDYDLRRYAIVTSGARVYDRATGADLHVTSLDHRHALELVRALRAAFPGIAFASERGEEFVREPQYVTVYPPPPGHLVAPAEEWLDAPVLKIMMKHADVTLDEMDKIAREFANDEVHFSTTGGTFVEMLSTATSKLAAVEALCAHLEISADEVVAFGDWPNDIPMLRWARTGVAPASAHAEVLDAADEICGSNDEDGVPRFLDELVRGDR